MRASCWYVCEPALHTYITVAEWMAQKHQTLLKQHRSLQTFLDPVEPFCCFFPTHTDQVNGVTIHGHIHLNGPHAHTHAQRFLLGALCSCHVRTLCHSSTSLNVLFRIHNSYTLTGQNVQAMQRRTYSYIVNTQQIVTLGWRRPFGTGCLGKHCTLLYEGGVEVP